MLIKLDGANQNHTYFQNKAVTNQTLQHISVTLADEDRLPAEDFELKVKEAENKHLSISDMEIVLCCGQYHQTDSTLVECCHVADTSRSLTIALVFR